jgi:hypothetical protein
MLESEQNVAGMRMTCSNPDCDCELEIVAPCPHGNGYTCACGHEFEAVQSN